MNFFNEEELYKYFKETIERATTKEMALLHDELVKLRDKTYREINRIYEQKKMLAIDEMDSKFALDYQKHLSRLEQELSRNISQFREELIAKLMTKVKKRYFAYQQTDRYVQHLQKALDSLDKNQIEKIELSTLDYQRLKANSMIPLMENSKIQAGYRAYYRGGKRLIDATLDSKLQIAKEWLYQQPSLQLSLTQDEVKA